MQKNCFLCLFISLNITETILLFVSLSSFESLKTSTDGIKERYAELAQGVDQLTGKNVTLSDDEYKEFLNLSNQLAKLFPSLTKNYDDNGNAIVDLTGDVNSIVSSLDVLFKM